MTQELVFERSILDPVHGLIHLTGDEVKLIDAPIFRRLRGTKQNGLLWLVFPSATHTRFEHSLGVLCLADAMWHALLANSKMATIKKPPRVAPLRKAKAGQAVLLSDLDDRLRLRAHRILRTAALCHDLGHGPLSHTFDRFAPTLKDLSRYLTDHRLISVKRQLEAWMSGRSNSHSAQHVKHEVMSCVFVAATLADMGVPDARELARAVTAVILGPRYISNNEPVGMRRLLPLLHDIVASAPADADRMDYLVRDTASIGVTYGLFDRNRVFKSLLVYADGTPKRRAWRLGLRRSGLRAIENLIQARFELFVQIYYHKTNRAIGLMLEEVASSAEARSVFNWADLHETMETYCDLDDQEFLRRLTQCPDPEVVEVVRRIRERRLWKRVTDVAPARAGKPRKVSALATRKAAERERRRLDQAVAASQLMVDVIDPKATKDLQGGAALLSRAANGIYCAHANTNWLAASPIIRTLGEVERAIARIYTKSENPGIVARLRKAALRGPHADAEGAI